MLADWLNLRRNIDTYYMVSQYKTKKGNEKPKNKVKVYLIYQERNVNQIYYKMSIYINKIIKRTKRKKSFDSLT